jgi:hypothetical protein
MRIASGSTNAHWASRGFIVLAADYPGLGLTDQLNAACGYELTGEDDVEGDVRAQLDAATQRSGELAFLGEHVDTTRVAISGHSQGACLSATFSTLPNVQLVMPMTGSTQVSPSPSLESIMWIAGIEDTVIGYDAILLGNVVCPPNPLPATSNVDGYDNSPGAPDVKKRLVGITGGGHLVPTDLCQKNMQGRNAIEEASLDEVCGVDTAVIIGLPALFDCGVEGFDWQKGVEAVNYASTAALEETLQCKDRDAAFETMQAAVPLIGDYRHDP